MVEVYFLLVTIQKTVKLDINTDCEAVACKVELSDNRTLIVLVIYRPPNRDLQYTQSICNLIEYLCCTFVNAIIWITGDFNLPNINWELNTVVSNAYPLELCNMLLDISSTSGFTQLVDSPTRGNNILNLFLTNTPGLIDVVNVSSSISDHKLIIIKSPLAATLTESQVHTIFLWQHADWQALNERRHLFS